MTEPRSAAVSSEVPSPQPLPPKRAPSEPKRRGILWPLIKAWRLSVIALSLAVYFSMAPFGYGFFMLLALVPTKDPVRRARFLQGIMCRAFAGMHHWLRWARVFDHDPRRLSGALPDGACMVVANHPTLADITAIMAALGGACTMVKPALYARWWLRPLLVGAAMVEGTSSPLGSAAVVEKLVQRLREGHRVVVFPESTRSPRGGIHPFGRSAFEAACRAGVPLVPLVVNVAPVWLSKPHRFFDPPRVVPRVELEARPALLPSGFGGDSRRLRDAAFRVYEGALGLRLGAE